MGVASSGLALRFAVPRQQVRGPSDLLTVGKGHTGSSRPATSWTWGGREPAVCLAAWVTTSIRVVADVRGQPRNEQATLRLTAPPWTVR
jgi:hypothetical protein